MPLTVGADRPLEASPGGSDESIRETLDLRWMPYRKFPYEWKLGIRELEALGAAILSHDREGEDISAVGDPVRIADRSTYFARVYSPLGERTTLQAQVEEAHLARRQGAGATRQATRYGLHGIHEYRGKFNPQVARALCNILDPDAKLLVDPFCGSGTALIEGMRLSMDVLGIDRSPMAVFLAEAKATASATVSKKRLIGGLESHARHVAEALADGQEDLRSADLEPILGEASVRYLERWFTGPAYAGISRAIEYLHLARRSVGRQLALVALSSILREVSLQLPDDLRIRRRPAPYTAPALAPMFAAAVAEIVRGLAETDRWPSRRVNCSVHLGDSSDPSLYLAARDTPGSMIVTSPPYATALPYVDTDRLSLVAMGLVSASDLMATEQTLLGSREWSRGEQRGWDERRSQNTAGLPASVTRLLKSIADANSDSGAGFRRKAVPSLLYRYFARMADVISAWSTVLAPGRPAAMIVGRNHTTAGGERVEIPTSDLLGDIAESRGFRIRELQRLETWPRYGLHAANGVTGEDALVIERGS